jgi:hypothetical protein
MMPDGNATQHENGHSHQNIAMWISQLMGEVQALRANRGRKLDGLVAIVTVARATVADGIVHSLEEGNGRGLRKARLIQLRISHRRQRNAAPSALHPRLCPVDQDPEDRGPKRASRPESVDPVEDAQPRVLHHFFGHCLRDVHGREPENRGVIALDQRDEGNAWWHQV